MVTHLQDEYRRSQRSSNSDGNGIAHPGICLIARPNRTGDLDRRKREEWREPLADCLWQVLYEMGIYANLSTERKKTTVYQIVDEVIREYYQRLNYSTEVQRRS
ncbi:MAG: hypothetical protein M0Q91_10470 [Methanoregula sp.]|nr:hypothetical protein [Methanoregula sp.]